MNLMRMNVHDVAAKRPRLAFWPVGTIEAHDQGPLGTDVIAPEKLAGDLVEEHGALLLPTLPYGLVSSLAGYPGGMWMTRETYERLIRELLASLSISGVKEVIVFNGHGGNSGALGAALARVWKEQGVKAAFIDWWTLGQDISEEHFGAAGGHAGADELALVRAADPTLAPESWDGSRAHKVRPGLRVYPSPRSAIRYGGGEPKPMTPASAAAFYEALKERASEAVSEILAGWKAFDELDARDGRR